MQKIMCVVINVYEFGQDFFIFVIFLKFLYKYLKTILAKAVSKALWQNAENHMRPAQIKLHLDEMFHTVQKLKPHILEGR